MGKKAVKKAAKKTETKVVHKQATHFQVRDTTTDHNSEFNIIKATLEKEAGKKIKSEIVLMRIFELAKKQIENPSGEVLQYTKETFADAPGLVTNWNEDLSDVENIVECFKHKDIAIQSLNQQNQDNQRRIIELEKNPVQQITPGLILIDTTKINEWSELEKNFEGEDIEQKINNWLANIKNIVTTAEQQNNLLKSQVIEQNEQLEKIGIEFEKVKENSVQLQDPQFVCLLDQETAEAAQRTIPKLKEMGILKTNHPNELANFAIKKITQLY